MKKLLVVLMVLTFVVACEPAGQKQQLPDEAVELSNPFIHSVYFWFKEEVTEEQLAVFYADTEKLREIEVVKAFYTGKPANTNRPIVERSYDFAVIVHFEDLAGHDTYQQHPIHLGLLEKHSNLWERVMITDVE